MHLISIDPINCDGKHHLLLRLRGNQMDDGYIQYHFEKLTEPQKQCLRLVAELMSSKEIARILDISHHTVDQRLKRAQSILGVSGRAEAARALMSHEARHPQDDLSGYDALVHQSSEVPNFRYARNADASVDEWSPSADSVETELREQQPFFFEKAENSPEQSALFSALFETKRENQLSTGARLVVMLAIVISGLVAFALLVNLAEGLSRLV
ncbi:MAG: helix-turn-helix transcriptional regulator [Parasphingorhabdus sp.]|uniref:helix-turn-helix domain-containing protein n=2 Tax=Parasphingorhabdus sp. TaxID=2709688 RepID=UPI003296E14B